MSAELDQLRAQQQLLTDSLAKMLQGQWVGFPSVEANLYALDPNMQGSVTPDPPVTDSEYEAQDDPKA
jgi:hypothetical protein